MLKYNTEKFRTKLALIKLKGNNSYKIYLSKYFKNTVNRAKAKSLAHLILNDMPNTAHQVMFLTHLFHARIKRMDVINEILNQFCKKYKYYKFIGSNDGKFLCFTRGYYDETSGKYFIYMKHDKICLESNHRDFFLLKPLDNNDLFDTNIYNNDKHALVRNAIIINNEYEYKITDDYDCV